MAIRVGHHIARLRVHEILIAQTVHKEHLLLYLLVRVHAKVHKNVLVVVPQRLSFKGSQTGVVAVDSQF